MPARTLTDQDLAELFDVIPRTIRNWIKAKCPHSGTGKGRRFDGAEVAAWLKKNNLNGKVGRPEDSTDPSDPLKAARIRKENALAEKHEIAVAREKGLLIDRAEAEKANVIKFRTITAKLMGLASAVAPQIEGKAAPAIETELENRIRDILKELSQ